MNRFFEGGECERKLASGIQRIQSVPSGVVPLLWVEEGQRDTEWRRQGVGEFQEFWEKLPSKPLGLRLDVISGSILSSLSHYGRGVLKNLGINEYRSSVPITHVRLQNDVLVLVDESKNPRPIDFEWFLERSKPQANESY